MSANDETAWTLENSAHQSSKVSWPSYWLRKLKKFKRIFQLALPYEINLPRQTQKLKRFLPSHDFFM